MSELMTKNDRCGAAPLPMADRWLRALSCAIRACVLFVFAPILGGSGHGPWRRPVRTPSRTPRAGHAEPNAAAALLTADAGIPPTQPDHGLATSARRAPATRAGLAPGGSAATAAAHPVAIAVRATFSRQDYAALFAALAAPGSKLLDLSSARSVRPDLFTALAAEWTAARGSVPRLGILLSFEDWAILHDAATLQLEPLRARGVETEVFYEEQAYDDMLLPWFSHGQVVHNVAAVLTTLNKCEPAHVSPVVLEAAASLVYQEVRGGGSAAHIVGLAGIALAGGSRIKALAFAREALLYLGEEASTERCTALRILGLALMDEGKVIVASGILHGAIAMAIALGGMEDAADVLRQLGTYELNRGEVACAEKRFRAAIDLLQPVKSDLLATLHHSLAVALLQQGKGTAELHAVMALASRSDKRSRGAQLDMDLLGSIRSGRGLAS